MTSLIRHYLVLVVGIGVTLLQGRVHKDGIGSSIRSSIGIGASLIYKNSYLPMYKRQMKDVECTEHIHQFQ